MNRAVKITLLNLLLCCAASSQTAAFGVGFDLTLDYGISSISYENGTTVDAAKIEGGRTYKSTMREFSTIRDERLDDTSATDGLLYASTRGIGDWLPPWHGRRNPQVDSLTNMLRALKIATESLTEDSVSAALISVPLPWTAAQKESLRSATSRIELDTPVLGASAGKLAAMARGIDGDCKQDPIKYVLSIDLSRSALLRQLWVEECGIYDYTRQLLDTALRYDSFHHKCEILGSHECIEKAKKALRRLTNSPLPPLEDGNSIDRISGLVVYGENAADPYLNQAIKDVLLERSLAPYVSLSNEISRQFNPVFAVAQALAREFWGHMPGCIISDSGPMTEREL